MSGQVQTRICPRCDEANAAVAEACKHCGFGFELLAADPPGRDDHPVAPLPGFDDEPAPRNRLAIVGAVAVLMLCVAALVLCVVRGW